MGGTGSGIGLLHVDDEGDPHFQGVVAPTASPSYLVRKGDAVYAAGESGPTVSAFRRSGDSLRLLGQVASAGTFPCALTVVGSLLLAACYGDGAVSVHAVGADGAVQPAGQVLNNQGDGPHPAQDGPHAHGALQVDAAAILSTDLGTDSVFVHSLDESGLTRIGEIALPAGTGPRDLLQHPSGDVWVLGELSSQIYVLRRNRAAFTVVSSVALAGAEPGDHAAGLALGNNGRTMYVGLRGSNRVSVVPLTEDGELLPSVASTSCGGDWPRHLVALGGHLYVANQRSGTLATFDLHADGLPVLRSSIAVPSPTFLLVD